MAKIYSEDSSSEIIKFAIFTPAGEYFPFDLKASIVKQSLRECVENFPRIFPTNFPDETPP